MKIKYKKKLGEKSYAKLTIKIGEYELNDKITRSEVDKIIDIVNDIAKPKDEEKKKC